MKPDDFQERLFRTCSARRVHAHLIAEAAGVVSGMELLAARCAEEGLGCEALLHDGGRCAAGTPLARFEGAPAAIVAAENHVIGLLSKPSGVATAVAAAVAAADGRVEIVCGGWKKLPVAFKEPLRQAVQDGGARPRICEPPFTYLDKNYVRIFGGITAALEQARPLGRPIVVQVRGEHGAPAEETLAAARGGASIIMIDTGRLRDLRQAAAVLRRAGCRDSLRLAFAGSISLGDIERLSREDVDLLDIGYAVLDAPCLPLRFDVVEVER